MKVVKLSYGDGVLRSLQILRTSKSRISECLETVDRLFFSGFDH